MGYLPLLIQISGFFFAICDMNVLSMVCVEGIIFVIFYNFSRWVSFCAIVVCGWNWNKKCGAGANMQSSTGIPRRTLLASVLKLFAYYNYI